MYIVCDRHPAAAPALIFFFVCFCVPYDPKLLTCRLGKRGGGKLIENLETSADVFIILLCILNGIAECKCRTADLNQILLA